MISISWPSFMTRIGNQLKRFDGLLSAVTCVEKDVLRTLTLFCFYVYYLLFCILYDFISHSPSRIMIHPNLISLALQRLYIRPHYSNSHPLITYQSKTPHIRRFLRQPTPNNTAGLLSRNYPHTSHPNKANISFSLLEN